MTTLRWLHFTDLHIGQTELNQGYWSSIREAIHDDLRRSSKALGPFDLVIFTGDLAFSGAKEQYAKLDAELEAIWALFAEVRPGAAPPVLLAVPGNHDFARPAKHDPVAEQLLEKEHGRDDLWSGEENQQVLAVRSWFREYAAWWERRQPTTTIKPGRLPGDFTYTFEKEGRRFGFLGLNVAFLHLNDGVTAGKLQVDARQILDACGGDALAWAKKHDFAFLLTHHPPEWLAPEARSHLNELIAPADRFTAHLCGHLHDALVMQSRAGRGATREIWQGAALFGMEKAKNGTTDRRHGYTVGHLEVEEDGTAQTKLWPRLAVKRQDDRWRITADVTHELDDDLLSTPSERVRSARPLARVPSPAAVELSPSARTWPEVVEQSPLWPSADPDLDQARAIATKSVSACWEFWQAADNAVPGDPWRDEELPIRTLAHLETLVSPSNDLRAAEIALLLTAPFLREGLFAAGAQWMAQELQKNKPDSLARKMLNEMLASRPDLERRLTRLTGTARAAVEHWLWTCALRQCPQLWKSRPQLPPASALVTRIEQIAKDEGAPAWMRLDRLMQLVRHVGVSPEIFQAEETIDRMPIIEAGGVRLRLSALARLLCAAGAWALELRRADDLVADHAGREGFEVVMARNAIRSARWVSDKDVHRLVQRCADPVVDFILRDDLVKRADQVIRRLVQDRDASPALSCGLLARLPAQLRADIEIETGPNGRQHYRVPHVRFQLDHNRVRELLMGEQLYGDPSLAVRELYQNALDACRYRKARVQYLGPLYEYEGQIVFRQDVDEEGREYIECEDNGGGMTAGILENVFAVAGRRFKDMPEYLEERARWDASGKTIELWPNSRFGIGVLSYFMLADEVKVWTRRFEPDGRLRDAVVAHISSVSGLFRVEEGQADVMAEGGTRVRIYLKGRTYRHRGDDEREISCGAILKELLWVAEFAAFVEERDKEPLRWQPGVLSPGGHAASPSSYLPTESPDIWWAACSHSLGARKHDESQPMLIDGIVTETKIAGPLVNLRAGRGWALSVDRKQVQAWDKEWVEGVLHSSFARLPGWEGLTMMFLWDLASHRARLARLLIHLLVEQDAILPVATLHNKHFEHTRGSGVRVRDMGVLPTDGPVLLNLGRDEPENLFWGWRARLWLESRAVPRPARWEDRAHIARMPVQPVELGDDVILRIGPYRFYSDALSPTRLVFFTTDLLTKALRLRRPVPEIIARIQAYEFLGFELDLAGTDPQGLEGLRIHVSELPEVNAYLSAFNAAGMHRRQLAALDVLTLSLKGGLGVQEVACLLAPLGVPLVSEELGILAGMQLADDDWCILSRNLNGRGPWVTGEISPLHLLYAAKQLRMPARSLVEALNRFEPLGIRAPQVDTDRLDHLEPGEQRLLSDRLTGKPRWLGSRVPVAHLEHIAEELNISMGEAWRRLEALSWIGIVLPATDADTLDALEHEEPELRYVARCFEEAVSLAGNVAEAAAVVRSRDHALRLAVSLGVPIPDPLRTAFEALAPDLLSTRAFATILRAYESSPGRDQETRRRRGRALARYHLWKPTDAELDADIARLEPVIDYITREPKL